MKPISDVRELRVDNIVYNQHKNIDRFGYSDFMKFKHPQMGGNYGFYEVPLTDQWLIELGFDKSVLSDKTSYKKYKSPGCPSLIIHLVDEKFIEYVHQVEIKSVHHLQNLYFEIRREELHK